MTSLSNFFQEYTIDGRNKPSKEAVECDRMQQISQHIATFLNKERKKKAEKIALVCTIFPHFRGNTPLFLAFFMEKEHGKEMVQQLLQHANFMINLSDEACDDLCLLIEEKLTDE